MMSVLLVYMRMMIRCTAGPITRLHMLHDECISSAPQLVTCTSSSLDERIKTGSEMERMS